MDKAFDYLTRLDDEIIISCDAKKLADVSNSETSTTSCACVSKMEVAEKEDFLKCSMSDWTEFEGKTLSELFPPGGESKAVRFLTEVSYILLQFYAASRDRKSKVLDFHHPHQLMDTMSHCLELDEKPRDLEQILSDCKETLKYCVKTGHAHFFNQLSTGIDVVGVAGEWLTAMANTNMFTYEVAPVFTMMEDIVLRRMLSKLSWDGGDGIFSPGGAISNLYGMLLARYKAFPSIKTSGFPSGVQLVVFTSEHSHYSIQSASILLGLGTDNCVMIKCDSRGRMKISDLERRITEALMLKKTPLMVNAMAGTTVLGAFDPLESVAKVCENHGLWMHVDGAWGGSMILSRDHSYHFKGVERADSMTWNPHKMMGVPLQCSAILCRHKGLLDAANSTKANYLFNTDKIYDVTWDRGDKSIQCGRRNDVFKLWLMWRAKGDDGFQTQINHYFEVAKYLEKNLEKRPGFHVVCKELQSPNVCFWYLPRGWRHLNISHIPTNKLNKVAPIIKGRMLTHGTIMVQYQPLSRLPNFFRVAISNPLVMFDDVDFLIDEIDRLGHDIPYE